METTFLLLITSYCLAVYQFRQVPPTAYYFSQLKQGTSLVRLKYHLGCTVDPASLPSVAITIGVSLQDSKAYSL